MKQVKPIRIAAYVDPPLVNDCFDSVPKNENCIFPGYEAEYIYTVLNGMLRFPVEWLKVQNKEELIAYLDNNSADIMGQSESLINRHLIQNWGYPPAAYLYDSLALLVRESYVSQSQIFVLLKSFTWDLWSFIMVMSLVCLTIRHVSKSVYGNLLSFRHFCVKIFEYLLHKFRANVCYTAWFLFLSVLLNFYSNLIAVDLVAPDKVKSVPFQTLTELGEKLLTKECRFIILKQYVNSTDINLLLLNPIDSEKLWANTFVQAYVTNPPMVVENRSIMVDTILNSSNPCFVGVDWSTLDLYYTTRYCNLRIMTFPEEINLLGYTFYTTRADIKEYISSVVLSEPLQAYITFLNDKYYSNTVPLECSSNQPVTVVPPVNMLKMQDSFYILALGLFVAFLLAIYLKFKDTCLGKKPVALREPSVVRTKL